MYVRARNLRMKWEGMKGQASIYGKGRGYSVRHHVHTGSGANWKPKELRFFKNKWTTSRNRLFCGTFQWHTVQHGGPAIMIPPPPPESRHHSELFHVVHSYPC
jgi:hypothetical protein